VVPCACELLALKWVASPGGEVCLAGDEWVGTLAGGTQLAFYLHGEVCGFLPTCPSCPLWGRDSLWVMETLLGRAGWKRHVGHTVWHDFLSNVPDGPLGRRFGDAMF
jgi:hypothetical protein